MNDYANGHVSYWMRDSVSTSAPRPALDTEPYDLVVVGAGLTGMWTAYYAKKRNPTLRVAVLEAEQVGFGASGRNGGWLSSLLPGNRAVYARSAGLAAVQDFQREMFDAVTEVLHVCRTEHIEADQHLGGNVTVATTVAGMRRLEARRRADLKHGYTEADSHLLTADMLRSHVDVARAQGGLFYPHVASVDPARLVRGLGQVVRSLGVDIYEHTRVTSLEAGVARTARGSFRAERIACCTEGYSGPLVGRRRIVPVNSSMIITEPLGAEHWDRIGWGARPVLNDAAHTFVYAQRTADDRIAIGGRGSPYRYASGAGDGTVDAKTVELLRGRLSTFFPGLDFPVAHAWSGVLGVTRDWCASIEYTPRTGLGTAMGYAGHGVTATNLAARTLLDRMFGESSGLTRLPWNEHRSGRWEPEPIRWLGIHGMYRLFTIADAWEEARRSRNTSLLARVGSRLAGLSE